MLTRIVELPSLPDKSYATEAGEAPEERIETGADWGDSRPDSRARVLFVEDMAPCARAFKRALAAYGIDIVVAADLSQARRLLQGQGEQFDAVLLDLHLPDGRGEDLLPEIEALARQPGIVVLSDFLDEVRPEVTSYRAVLVPKTIAPVALAALLHQGAAGYAHDTLVRFAAKYRLTRKEVEILGCVARGASPKQTAADLVCSVQVVYVHLAGVCTKTGCASYHEVVAKLFQFSCHGLGHEVGTSRSAGRFPAHLADRDSQPSPSR
ncbi:MAG TPA: response regulator [Polyangia bacterium]